MNKELLWLVEDERVALPSLSELIRALEFGQVIRLRLNSRTDFRTTKARVIEVGSDCVELDVYDIDSTHPYTWSRVLLVDQRFDIFMGEGGMSSIATCLAINCQQVA